jgi:hypothetical protein
MAENSTPPQENACINQNAFAQFYDLVKKNKMRKTK